MQCFVIGVQCSVKSTAYLKTVQLEFILQCLELGEQCSGICVEYLLSVH